MPAEVLVDVDALTIQFHTPGGTVHAVDDVSFDVATGETVALVGESGSGKTTIGRSLLGLSPVTGGTIEFGEAASRRGGVQLVYQDPYASLDPRWTIERTVAEPLGLIKVPRARRREKVLDALDAVGMDESFLAKYPHQLSGGQRQRVAIARALVSDPSVIVCDESVSALDVSVQAQVLNLLRRIKTERGVAFLFITHDLSVVRYIADTVVVLYLGRVVEIAPKDVLYNGPKHPYSIALLGTAPRVEDADTSSRIRLQGEIPSAVSPPAGCAFASRCPLVTDRCIQERPKVIEQPDGSRVACHRADDVAAMDRPESMFEITVGSAPT